MAKFQFFVKPNDERKNFTYLEMKTPSFIAEREQLLSMGFEVRDDCIHADSAASAVEKFRSDYIYAIEEYNNSTPIGALTQSVIYTYQYIRDKFQKK
ncbi:hypothetical protein PCNPT3_05270 [Psychromonas sp. CNPT3]|uniref:hypothetical protein n=1 Tax=Psychromonas sp. CNPT3 TaxID=314282 RepID=UPI00006E48B2|nr:hypothetical protein [Psychromonas sp. CNPT3]AGH80996.1 hypothetical protein PCNPT3_05270 [Psychromonas sp. CNPT3]